MHCRLLFQLVLFLLVPFSLSAQEVYVDSVTVYKADRVMKLWKGRQVIHSFKVGLGDAPKGRKTTQGDEKTPEGRYVLDFRNPNSAYYRSIHISYPNAKDIGKAKRRSVSPGGDIYLHGSPDFADDEPMSDWTDGCIAIKNKEMDICWQKIKDGTLIVIYP